MQVPYGSLKKFIDLKEIEKGRYKYSSNFSTDLMSGEKKPADMIG
jgi:hypothetical protein